MIKIYIRCIVCIFILTLDGETVGPFPADFVLVRFITKCLTVTLITPTNSSNSSVK